MKLRIIHFIRCVNIEKLSLYAGLYFKIKIYFFKNKLCFTNVYKYIERLTEKIIII